MLRSAKDMQQLAVRATDGNIGHVRDLYFDDHAWVVRYLIVSTGSWLSHRKVLISPLAAGSMDWGDKILPVSISREQVRNSPDIDTDKPVSRQHESDYLAYYGYPHYWGDTGLWGAGPHPGLIMMPGQLPGTPSAHLEAAVATAEAKHHEADDPHLRSCQEVRNYHIRATDGEIGHLQDVLIEEDSWAIRYLIVNTSNWWLGHAVLVAPQWIQEVSWPENAICVNLTRAVLQNSPPYDPAIQLDRTREADLYEHYGRPGYWADKTRSKVDKFTR